MATIVTAPSTEITLLQVSLVTSTADIVHPDLSTAPAEVMVVGVKGLYSRAVAELTTNNVSIINVPVVITDCAPLTAVVDLNTAFIGVAIVGVD